MLKPVRRKVKKEKVTKNSSNFICPGANFVHSEILRVLKTYRNVIKGKIANFKKRFPILHNQDICQEIEQTIILKITEGITNRIIQLHKIEARQTNVLIQRITNNCIIDELRRLEKIGGDPFHYNEDEESELSNRKYDLIDNVHRTNFTSYIVGHTCPNKYSTCGMFDSPEFLLRMKEIHEIIKKELYIYDRKAYRLYIQIFNGECALKTNTPNIVKLRKEVKSIIKYYSDK
jgi:hypothetical protein